MGQTMFHVNLTEPICRYCGCLTRIIPEFEQADFHTSATCVEAVEPSRKMGGPA